MAPRVASNPRCITPAQRPPFGSRVMSLRRQPGSIGAATPARTTPEVSTEQKEPSSVPQTSASSRAASDQTGLAVGTRVSVSFEYRSRRGASGSVQSSSPRDQSGDSPIIAPASQTRCATDPLISGMSRLVQHAKAPPAGFSGVDEAAADAIGGQRSRIETRQGAAADQRQSGPRQIGIGGERIRDLRSDQQSANIGAGIGPRERA